MESIHTIHDSIRRAIHEKYPSYDEAFADAKFAKANEPNTYVANAAGVTIMANYKNDRWHIRVLHAM